mmetsp:Transcript_59764/g.146810  ORF Transcript_59764/g.146810 Transcript_59764/m.146810 type:complete len:250 (-) Transcript_59764:470-1219(-)|eukprot:CAMPEP_0206227464 /NCGR_PEP_ID=MMETSP0047_2-20121206/8639_1 /ASSEMBLY_ACC=CAM_ASM_000192 /TAXON_ID=195065 /ORGANISM="Chroomonas mesostigmatica_cf, Strain CCMP1168" /LENGTH=249 /DNA_ID=CAMNT_0053650621 /DNA_START=195 /DNA_END=944 /DNA_ORIENTATION=+
MHTRHGGELPAPAPVKTDQSLSPKRTKANDGSAVLSPNCVAAVADMSLAPPSMELGGAKPAVKSPERQLKHKTAKKDAEVVPPPPPPPVEADAKANANPFESVRHHKHHGGDEDLPHACWWTQLLELKGETLIERLRNTQLDELIDYHGGVLNARFVEKIVRLYDHVNCQADVEGGVYAKEGADLELPYLCPGADQSGFSRLERLEMAAEYDIWQWYLVTGENYNLLDTLVWMGVQMKKLWSRPVTPTD